MNLHINTYLLITIYGTSPIFYSGYISKQCQKNVCPFLLSTVRSNYRKVYKLYDV